MTDAIQGTTATRSVVLFVIGMARSGTSALTRVLSLCGGTLPPGMVGANKSNPLGYWEPRKAIYLNEAILYRHRSAPYDPTLRLQEENAFDANDKAACVAEISAYLSTLPAAPLLIIKEARVNLLSDMWFEAVRLAGSDIVTVIAVRHPQEVAASLARHMGASPELSSALWLKYNLLAERNTRGLPRVFVEYPNLLGDWRREIERISAALAIDLDNRDDAAIEEFLEQDLHRQRYSGLVRELFGTDWISTVYESLHAAARDELWDGSTLDRVFEAYRASEHDFRRVFADFHRYYKFRVLLRPSVMKLIGEVLAFAHRRSGTWA
ncbi:hypothetical protein JMUB5695_00145 [Mycobacterium heckeshornense]|uniref:sulfotransferase family protein n=1 Tax=Mycobacterium heckeshornense TaxID=110505 RepID=UPI001AF902CA|nr:sulfotransferase family protein [Mycobacterium heckeshornense]BCQ06736.1 hypothetical protein JMUB5695_00145 [Mycobacterium heckeshornense]